MQLEPVTSLKILLLCYVRTADHTLCRLAGGYPRSQTYQFVKEVQRRLHPWNARLPSTLELRNLADRASHLRSVAQGSHERTILKALTRALEVVASTPTAWEAGELLLDAHADMRQMLAAILPKNRKRSVQLLNKLERDITESSRRVGALY